MLGEFSARLFGGREVLKRFLVEAEVSLGARLGLVAFQLVRGGEDLATDFTSHRHRTLPTGKTR